MSVKVINKSTKPEGHVGPKRWIKYVARTPPLMREIKHPEQYLHYNHKILFNDDAIKAYEDLQAEQNKYIPLP
jgi:hypothetical protein